MILKTNRLKFKVIQEEDIQILHQNIFTNSNVMKFAFSEKIFSQKETDEFIDKYFAKDIGSKIGLYPIFLKDKNILIGFSGFLEFEYLNQNEYEFGFIIANNFWGQGYATEIGQAQIDFAFKNLQLEQIFSLTNKENISSKKVLDKLNMKYIDKISLNGRGSREVYKLKNITKHSNKNMLP